MHCKCFLTKHDWWSVQNKLPWVFTKNVSSKTNIPVLYGCAEMHAVRTVHIHRTPFSSLDLGQCCHKPPSIREEAISFSRLVKYPTSADLNPRQWEGALAQRTWPPLLHISSCTVDRWREPSNPNDIGYKGLFYGHFQGRILATLRKTEVQ